MLNYLSRRREQEQENSRNSSRMKSTMVHVNTRLRHR